MDDDQLVRILFHSEISIFFFFANNNIFQPLPMNIYSLKFAPHQFLCNKEWKSNFDYDWFAYLSCQDWPKSNGNSCPQITKKSAILVRTVSFVATSDPMRTAKHQLAPENILLVKQLCGSYNGIY